MREKEYRSAILLIPGTTRRGFDAPVYPREVRTVAKKFAKCKEQLSHRSSLGKLDGDYENSRLPSTRHSSSNEHRSSRSILAENDARADNHHRLTSSLYLIRCTSSYSYYPRQCTITQLHSLFQLDHEMMSQCSVRLPMLERKCQLVAQACINANLSN